MRTANRTDRYVESGSRPARQLQALFVEDSQDDVELVLHELKRGGFAIRYRVVETEPAYLSSLREQPWDIVLSDFSMPRFDGMKAFELLQKMDLDVPFIFVSGRIGEDRAAEAMRRGASDYVLKDNLTRLVPAVEREVREAEMRRQRRAADLALVASEEKYRTLLESSIQGVGVIRLGKVLFANAAFARLFGFRDVKDLLAEASIVRFAAAEDNALLFRADRERLAGKPFPVRAEMTLRRKDGSPFVADASLNVVDWEGQEAVLAVLVDVTERKSAEAELQASQRLLQTVFDTLPQCLVVKDSSARYVMVNRAWCDRYGSTPDQVLGRRMEEIGTLPEELVRESGRHDGQVLGDGGQTVDLVGLEPVKGGEWRYAHIIKTPLRDAQGGVTGLLGTVIDLHDRYRAEEELRANERLLQTVFDTIPHMLIVKDTGSRLLMVNKAWAEAYDLSQDQVANLGTLDLPGIPELKKRELLAEDRLVFDGKATHIAGERILTVKGGKELPVLSIKAPLRNGGGKVVGLVGVFVDISDRVRAEREMRASERLLSTVYNTFPYSVAVKDAQCRYQMVNRAWTGETGIEAQAALGKTLAELYRLPDEVLREFDRKDRQVLESGEVLASEEDHYDPQGKVHRYYAIRAPLRDDDGRIAGIVDGGFDITAQKEAQVKADMAHARLFDAIESLPAAFFLYDADQRLTLWNSRVREFYPEVYASLHEGMAYERILRQIAASGHRPVENVEEWVQRSLSQFRDDSTTTECTQADGRCVQAYDRRTSDGGTVSLRFDITALKSREQELRQAQKMEAVGQLTGGVAHDFNNLLQVISGFIELGRKDLGPAHPVDAALRTADDACRRAADLTRQLLAFSRKQVLRPEELNLIESVRGIAKLMGRLLPSNITLNARESGPVEPIVADRGMIEQVLMNLAVNSRDAMPDGGTIEVETGMATLDDAFCGENKWARPGRYATLRLTDTGVGMTPEVRERIFEPFFTTKGLGKGTGLGLSMVYGIVQQHNGLIHVESEPGVGTTFRIYWPVRGKRQAAADTALEIPVTGGTETILVAEDNDLVRQVVVSALKSAGYSVRTAADGAEAIQILAREAGKIAFAILDMTMPKMGGKATFLEMKKIKPNLRALFTSGWYGPKDQSFFANEQQATLDKPFTRDKLLRTVRECLDRPQ